jgi:hypothetical protein
MTVLHVSGLNLSKNLCVIMFVHTTHHFTCIQPSYEAPLSLHSTPGTTRPLHRIFGCARLDTPGMLESLGVPDSTPLVCSTGTWELGRVWLMPCQAAIVASGVRNRTTGCDAYGGQISQGGVQTSHWSFTQPGRDDAACAVHGGVAAACSFCRRSARDKKQATNRQLHSASLAHTQGTKQHGLHPQSQSQTSQYLASSQAQTSQQETNHAYRVCGNSASSLPLTFEGVDSYMM